MCRLISAFVIKLLESIIFRLAIREISIFLLVSVAISSQSSHRLEKYLNIQDCLEKSLKIKFALKSTRKTLKVLEKSLNFTIYRKIQQCFWNLNQYKIVVPLATPNRGTTGLY